MQICLNWKHKELWLFFMSFISDSAIFQKKNKKKNVAQLSIEKKIPLSLTWHL